MNAAAETERRKRLGQSLKTVLVGIVIGAAALAIILFATGVVVTSGSAEKSAQEAAVDVQAQICASEARKLVGLDVDLSGRDKKSDREKLAEEHAPILSGAEKADAAVIKACADKLA